MWGIGSTRSDTAPCDTACQADRAYGLLCSATQRGIQVPADVVTAISEARQAGNGPMDIGQETRFWNAYGLLSSSIQPAEKARRTYKLVFYAVLAFLLSFQFYYLAAASVRDRLDGLAKEEVEAAGKATITTGNKLLDEAKAASEKRLEQIGHQRDAYFSLATALADLPGASVRGLVRAIGFDAGEPWRSNEVVIQTIVRSKLDMILLYLSGYVLPILYGLLGACAFVLRKLSDEIDKLTYAHDARVRYTLRLNVGMLSGLAMGWFVKTDATEAATLTTLSPLALAFVAGYGSDLLFTALDKIVATFSSPTGASASTVTTTTAGGITTRTVEKREAHVAEGGLAVVAGLAQKEPRVPAESMGTEPTPLLPKAA